MKDWVDKFNEEQEKQRNDTEKIDVIDVLLGLRDKIEEKNEKFDDEFTETEVLIREEGGRALEPWQEPEEFCGIADEDLRFLRHRLGVIEGLCQVMYQLVSKDPSFVQFYPIDICHLGVDKRANQLERLEHFFYRKCKVKIR